MLTHTWEFPGLGESKRRSWPGGEGPAARGLRPPSASPVVTWTVHEEGQVEWAQGEEACGGLVGAAFYQAAQKCVNNFTTGAANMLCISR